MQERPIILSSLDITLLPSRQWFVCAVLNIAYGIIETTDANKNTSNPKPFNILIYQPVIFIFPDTSWQFMFVRIFFSTIIIVHSIHLLWNIKSIINHTDRFLRERKKFLHFTVTFKVKNWKGQLNLLSLLVFSRLLEWCLSTFFL